MTHAMQGRPRLAAGLLALTASLALAGCAASAPAGQEPMEIPGPRVPGPAVPDSAIAMVDLFAPSSSVMMAAAHTELTGMELGRMWLFENPPLDYWRETYGFAPDSAWLEHVRLASVRYADYCSGSFVSPNGLVMTNHHCARECVEDAAGDAVDYVQEGFVAETQDDEVLCPGLTLQQLVEIGDVTNRVKWAAARGASDTEAAAARDSIIDVIEAECSEGSGDDCEVVDLYHGGQYHLYRYRIYEPVKLVFAPDLQAGQFGGDPDNFTYPRFNLDVSFVRAYQPDSITPAETPDYFPWDPDGAEAGEAVFVTGNPGSTNRLRTVAQLMYMKEFDHPFQLQYIQGLVDFLRFIAQQGPDMERAVREDLATFENGLKATKGELDGLQDTLLMGRKLKWEQEFKRRVISSGELRNAYGDAWDRIAAIQREKVGLEQRHTVYDPTVIGDPHLALAGMLVTYIRQSALPEDQRREGLDQDSLDALAEQLRQPTPYSPEIGARLLAIRLELARDWLRSDDPVVQMAFRSPGEGALEAARRLVYGSRIADAGYRGGLLDGGPNALAASNDPMVRMARTMADAFEEMDAELDEIGDRESAQEERLAQALFPVFGTDIPPDATFTLRITDGVVERYPYNGTFAAPFTTYYGLYGRNAAFGGEHPWDMHPRWAEHRGDVSLATRLNFVATTDITGGNSGSPIIDAEGRVVGAAFDGNIESLPNDFVFTTDAARTVGVHSAGILEALRAVYQADRLVAELMAGMNPE